MRNYKWLLVAAVSVLLLAFCTEPRAAEICGVDVTPYKPIDHTRWRTSDETLVAEKVIFGTPPNKAHFFIMSFHHDGVWDSVIKYLSKPGVVTDVRTCVEQSEADYNAAHEALAMLIDPKNTTRKGWEPGD